MNQFLQLRSGEEYVNKKILMFDLVYVGPVTTRLSLMTTRRKVDFACNLVMMAAGYSTHTANLLLRRERMLLQSLTVTMHRFSLQYCLLVVFSKRKRPAAEQVPVPLSGCKSQVNGVSRRLYAGSRGRSQSVRVSVFHSWIESKAAFGCESSARVLIGRSGSPTAIPAWRGDGGSIRRCVLTNNIFC